MFRMIGKCWVRSLVGSASYGCIAWPFGVFVVVLCGSLLCFLGALIGLGDSCLFLIGRKCFLEVLSDWVAVLLLADDECKV